MTLPGNTLGERIRFRRENLGMLQKTLAKVTGIHVNTIARIEQDEGDISAAKLQLICLALNVKMDTIMPKVPYELEHKINACKAESNRKQFLNRYPKKGEPLSEKHLQALRKVWAIPIIQLDTSGNIIAEFASLNEAVKKTGVYQTGISFCINGKQKSAGGYIWKRKLI